MRREPQRQLAIFLGSISILLITSACGERTLFSRGGDSVDQVDKASTTNEAEANSSTTAPIATPTKKEAAKVATASGDLTVLFLTDVAGSMTKKDPVVDGSCKRLQAIQGIIDSIKSQATSGVKVKGALVLFNDAVNPADTVALRDVTSLETAITVANACKGEGKTSYVAPLRTAQNILKGNTGPAVAYLLSDGVPNVAADGSYRGDNDPIVVSDTLAAADSLKKAAPSLVINSLMIGNNGEGNSASQELALSTMNGVASGESHSYEASSSAKLMNAVLKLGESIVCLAAILC